MGALAEQGADFFVVEAADEFDRVVGRRGVGSRAGGDKGFDGGEGTEFVVHAAGEDKFFFEAAELGWLSVEELEFPVEDCAVCGGLGVR